MQKNKPNPKIDKSARRERNPLRTIGYSPDGRRGGYYKKIEQCKNCLLRSAVTDDGYCAECK